jgi:hypothetical protein
LPTGLNQAAGRGWPDWRRDARLSGVAHWSDEYRELDNERVLVLADVSARGRASGVELGEMGVKAAKLFAHPRRQGDSLDWSDAEEQGVPRHGGTASLVGVRWLVPGPIGRRRSLLGRQSLDEELSRRTTATASADRGSNSCEHTTCTRHRAHRAPGRQPSCT